MNSVSQLTPLLPSTPYILAYSLPLLLLSLVLTFAGTFLTLDRSRSFPSRGTGTAYSSLALPGALDQPKSKKKLTWALEGGIGGLIGGYVFGVHLSSALALLIPATTNSKSLSPKSFLAIWILSSIITTPLAGRYRYAAYLFLGVSGGTMSSLALCVIIHPALSSRVVLTSVFLPLFTILSLIFASIPRISNTCFHSFLRICTASTGAFGVIVSVALLLHPQQMGWANVWERLWTKDGEGWGVPREQALSAAFFIFFAAGMVADWALKRWVGECPDEKWDNYLAHYTANLPNQADRAGTFQPLTSFWDKFFGSSSQSVPTTPFGGPEYKRRGSKDILFPNETDLKSQFPLPVTMHNIGPGKLSKKDSKEKDQEGMLLQRLPTRTETLRKPRQKGFAAWSKAEDRSNKSGGRKPVKFWGNMSSDSDSDEEDDDPKKAAGISASSIPSGASSPVVKHRHPFALGQQLPSESYSSSAPTLVDGRVGRARQGEQERRERDPQLDVLATLDYEKEIEAVKDRFRPRGRRGNGQSKAQEEEVEYSDYEEDLTALKGKADNARGEGWSPAFLKRHQSHLQGSETPTMTVPMTPGAVPVPATPSLIKAIDRIAVAQRDAFGVPVGLPALTTPKAVSKPSRDGSGVVDPLVTMEAGAKVEKTKERAPRWEEFWREVRVKAQS